MISDKLKRKTDATREEYLKVLKSCILNDQMSEKLELLIKELGLTDIEVGKDEEAIVAKQRLYKQLKTTLESQEANGIKCKKINDAYNKMTDDMNCRKVKYADLGSELAVLKQKSFSLMTQRMQLEKQLND